MGIETTTGPLGQGLANAVGMALAEKCWPRFNRPTASRHRRPLHLRVPRRRLPDGRHLARGLLAGRHARPRQADLLYDDNGISIDGEVQGWFTDDTPARFAAYGWQVIPTSTATTPRRSRGAEARPGQHGAADADLLQDRDRLGRAEQAGHRGDARRAAGCRRDRGDPRGARLAARAVRGAGRDPRRLGRSASAAQAPRRPTGSGASTPTGSAHPELAAEFERRMPASCRPTGPAQCAAPRRRRPIEAAQATRKASSRSR
jgi:transketolase